MWHKRTVEQFLVDRHIEAEQAKAITGRLTLRANADGYFSSGFLKEIIGDHDLAYSFTGVWATDPLGKKLQARTATEQVH